MATFLKNRVVVAMSGGIDSSVAAYLLKEQGYEVIGISMKTHDNVEPQASKSCCSIEDIQDARTVCHKLDIPFYSMNFKREFKEHVMDYFAREYSRGRTPNPCVKCNDQLKFTALLCQTRRLGAYYLATGHYVQKIKDEQRIWRLHKAKDARKDQSYFLFGLGQEQLGSLLFPLGELTKDEVRAIGRRAGLATAEKPESQEICFVPNNNYADVIERIYPELTKPEGAFHNKEGTVVGKHRGTHAYTVGQRRGLGVSTGKRLYVTAIDSDQNEVALGEDKDLYQSSVRALDVKWVGGSPPQNGTYQAFHETELEADVKIRYRHDPAPAQITVHDTSQATITFKEPQRAIAPGQAIVFYQGTELLGGGWIEKGLC